MSFLDKAKKLAEQAAEKAGPLIDKAAPHAQNLADKAGQQVDRRTGGKYHDKIEAAGAKVGELAEKRMTGRGGDPAAADGEAADGFPPAGAAPGETADGFPPAGAPARRAADGFPAIPDPVDGLDGTVPTRTDAGDAFPADPGMVSTPAQPDLAGGQPDDPAYPAAPSGGFSTEPRDDRAAEPAFSAETPEITFPAPPPAATFPAEPDSRAGQPDDPAHSLTPGGTTEFPGLSEGPLGAPQTEEDRPSNGPAVGGSGTPSP
jgi:hypothetical protein